MDDEDAEGEQKLVMVQTSSRLHSIVADRVFFQRLHSEMRIWKELAHPHVLELCGTVSDFGPHISLVCPWMKNGSVTKYMERSGDLLSTQDRMQLVSRTVRLNDLILIVNIDLSSWRRDSVL